MKSKIVNFKILVSIICFLSIFEPRKSFCIEQDKSNDKNETSGIAFEQALKNYDIQKQKDLEVLSGKLNFRLNQAAENWLNKVKSDKAGKLNTRLEQEWEKLSRTYSISSIHYEYDLRGYKYILVKSDVIKTDSLSSPYKAVVIVREELYVEKNHSSDISDANPYFYTVSTEYTLNFEYKNEKFNLINSDSKIVSIDNQCPDETKRWRL